MPTNDEMPPEHQKMKENVDEILAATTEYARLNLAINLEPPDPPLEDVLLAYLQFRGPLPEPGPTPRFTIRQRIRIWRGRKRCVIEQWIHDHLHHAMCDC